MPRDNSTFDATIQHACGNWEIKLPALLALRNWTDPKFFSSGFSCLCPEFFPSLFSHLFLAFDTMNEGEKDASSMLRHIAEQLLTLANTGNFVCVCMCVA